MTYLTLSIVLLLTLILILTCVVSIFLKFSFRKTLFKFAGVWLVLYAGFVLYFTGPNRTRNEAQYHLPWRFGDKHFVAQGNRSFLSHRDLHEGAWDFVMSMGTEVLAARSGRVVKVVEDFASIGLHSNVVVIEHVDGEKSGYAHIQKSLVRVGDEVAKGQVIALSGLSGQTLFPHLHFFVVNKEGSSPVFAAFSDVADGVPRAGRFYVSGNQPTSAF